MLRRVAAGALALALAGCSWSTPYQEMGFTGGVSAEQVTSDTYQISARGNAFVDADTIQRYALRKASETTVAQGYRYFYILDRQDRSRSVSLENSSAVVIGNTVYASGSVDTFIKPGESMMIRLVRATSSGGAPRGAFDAQDLLDHIAPPVIAGGPKPAKQPKGAPVRRTAALIDPAPAAVAATSLSSTASSSGLSQAAKEATDLYVDCVLKQAATLDDGHSEVAAVGALIAPKCEGDMVTMAMLRQPASQQTPQFYDAVRAQGGASAAEIVKLRRERLNGKS